MNSSLLSGAVLRTYQAVIEDPPTQIIDWSTLRPLLEQIGQVTADPNGNLTITRAGHVLVLHPALTKDIAESGELGTLRRFLQESDVPTAGATGRDPQLLLVIHGQEAKVYRCQVIGGMPDFVVPYEPSNPDPTEHGQRPVKRAPAPPKPPSDAGYFKPMADLLQIAGQIVVLGTGREAGDYVAWLQQHDSELAGRIIGLVLIDAQQLDEAGLLNAAREFYATLLPPGHEPAALRPAQPQWSRPRAQWEKTRFSRRENLG